MTTSKVRIVLLAVAAAVAVACGPSENLDVIADDYVQLTLAIGRHDSNYVDAYYGPEEWKKEAERGDPVPLQELLGRARGLLSRLEGAPPSDRTGVLEKQLIAAEAWLRIRSGESMRLVDEARLLFDIEIPTYDERQFAATRERLEELLPGDGDLSSRVDAFRKGFVIPAERLGDVARAGLSVTRAGTVKFVELPEGEAVRMSFVHDKPWGAYNWYQGNLESLIEVNTDLPIELASQFSTLSHESYPGHHTYNVLIEHHLVGENGWNEFTVYPLFSPMSLIAEGTANTGLEILMTDDERWAFIENRLAPLAGLEDGDFATYRAVLEALRGIRPVRGVAATMLLQDDADENEVHRFLVEYGLENPDRAWKTIEFIREYRSYIYTYFVGEDLVRAYLGKGPDRPQRFFAILKAPTLPSQLPPQEM